MSGEKWTIANEHQLEAFIKNVRELYKKNKRLVYPKPEIGFGRSLSQNALFHVWVKEYAAFLTNTNPNLVPTALVEGTKRGLKHAFYAETGQEWMKVEMVNALTGQKKNDFASTSNLAKGNMFMFMEFVQKKAAEDGLMLESKGDYEKFQKEQHGEL